MISQLCGIKGYDKVNYDKISKATEGYSGADMTAVSQEAKMELVRNKLQGKVISLSTSILLDSVKRILSSLSTEQITKYESFVNKHGKHKRK